MGAAASAPAADDPSSKDLTIRNLTATPIALTLVETFSSHTVRTASFASHTASYFSSLKNATAYVSRAIHPTGDALSSTSFPDGGIAIAPFTSLNASGSSSSSSSSTDDVAADGGINANAGVSAPDPASTVMRLTFTVRDASAPPSSQPFRYRLDIPTSSSRTTELDNLDAGPHAFAAVYLPARGFLALYSSAAPSAWMGALPDQTPLTALSIPGTHNSTTCYWALPSVRCQAVSVREQLDNGVRFLDVRVSVAGSRVASVNGTPTTSAPDPAPGAAPAPHEQETNSSSGVPSAATHAAAKQLGLVHGVFPIALAWWGCSLAQLLGDMYAFLAAHPSETILLSLKREGTRHGSDADLSRLLKEEICAHEPARWWQAAGADGFPASLGECRGRIVLLQRFRAHQAEGDAGSLPWGIDATNWPDKAHDSPVGAAGRVRIQDYYAIHLAQHIDTKIEYVCAQLERAAAEASSSSSPLFLNFLSGSHLNPSCWPERIAAKVNPSIIEYLCVKHGEDGQGPHKLPVGGGGTGVVILDWVGAHGDWDLVRCIVGMNARLQLQAASSLSG